MRKLLRFASLAVTATIAATAMFGLVGCGDKGGGGDIEIDENGNIRPSTSGETTVNFWGYGDQNEKSVFDSLVAQFNEKYKDDHIKVHYEQMPSGTYGQKVLTSLKNKKASVDIFYVGDADYKTYATSGYLEPLDLWIKGGTTEDGITIPASKEIKIEDMWETSVNRYLYDVDTTTQDGPNAHYWGIPKDIGPIVIYYNETQFNEVGIKVLSVAKEDLAAFNAGTKADARGKKKADLGITDEVKEKGYFVDSKGQKWFNNQVPMSWDETIAVADLLQQKFGATAKDYSGYYTEWWFNYGWSVGGDCIEYIADSDPQYNGGYWDLTLFEDTPNFIVADDVEGTVTVNGTAYKAGEIIAWKDKLVDVKAATKSIRPEVTALKEEGKLNQLPSQRDAMIEFVSLTTPKNKEVVPGHNGYAVSAFPKVIGDDSQKATKFAEKKVGMLVDGRWNVVDFRTVCGDKPGSTGDGNFEWDVAPLPQYKEYDAQGNVTVHGVEAGHSGSVALCINKKSEKKTAAWLFAEFIGGKTGQEAQAKSGFAIPSQKDLANSDVFLQPNQNPRNSIVFVRAAQFETPGDWWYLKDNKWINAWADNLNHKVREGDMTFDELVNSEAVRNTPALLKAYTKKNK